MVNPEIQKNVRHNFIVNVLDGTFFGAALGFASTVSVVTLFVSTLTTSTTLIGYVASMQPIGWYIPQLLTANYVTRQRRYKRSVLFLTIQERWPFLGLALAPWLIQPLGKDAVLAFTFLMLLWFSLGGGVTATAWQTMIAKIMPANLRGTFWGIQSAAANLMVSIAVIGAGFLLQHLPSPQNFSLCFFIASVFMLISWTFLARTREPENSPEMTAQTQHFGWHNLLVILKSDRNFRWFLVVRMLSQTAMMAGTYYTLYGLRHFGMTAEIAAAMTSISTLTQVVSSPLLGWLGDRWGHHRVFAFGILAMSLSAIIAWAAPDISWMYLAFALMGVANTVLWTIAMSLTIEFGTEAERPQYIGLANTLIAPAALIAPALGGWLADSFGFGTMFIIAAAGGLLTAFVLYFLVRDPRQKRESTPLPPVPVSA